MNELSPLESLLKSPLLPPVKVGGKGGDLLTPPSDHPPGRDKVPVWTGSLVISGDKSDLSLYILLLFYFLRLSPGARNLGKISSH